MKIIQSFALLPEDTSYYNIKNYNDKIYINLYYMLLSYLTLKEYYGSVTMYCNQAAYDKLIIYIPYDEVIILENIYTDSNFWSMYKVYVISKQIEPFIHVDTDVFIFDSVFDTFINGDYEMLCQDLSVEPIYNEIYNKNKTILQNNKLIKNDFIYSFTSGGVLGMKNNLNSVENYSLISNKLYELCKKNEIIADNRFLAPIIEEFGFYLTQQYYKYPITAILSQELIERDSRILAFNSVKYTHLWFKTKYIKDYCDMVKKKINTKYPIYNTLLNIFDKILVSKNIQFDYTHGVNVEQFCLRHGLFKFKKFGKDVEPEDDIIRGIV